MCVNIRDPLTPPNIGAKDRRVPRTVHRGGTGRKAGGNGHVHSTCGRDGPNGSKFERR